ncbi:hypothetical protein ACFLQW_04560 [Candidatus Zixiibacteriota bacterium]
MGNEGNWSTMVVDVNIMLVPDPSQATDSARKAVIRAYEKMKSREVLSFLSERRLREMTYRQSGRQHELEQLATVTELDMQDRHELDDAILKMFGIRAKIRRQELLERLYDFLREFFERTRQKEEKAIINKNLTKRRGRFRPADIAAQVVEQIITDETWLMQKYDSHFLDKDKPFDSYDIPEKGVPHQSPDMFEGSGLTFITSKSHNTGHIKTLHKGQDDLITMLVEQGYRGLLRVPHTATDCKAVMKEYGDFVQRRDVRLQELVAERTSDEDLQEKILDSLKILIQQ